MSFFVEANVNSQHCRDNNHLKLTPTIIYSLLHIQILHAYPLGKFAAIGMKYEVEMKFCTLAQAAYADGVTDRLQRSLHLL